MKKRLASLVVAGLVLSGLSVAMASPASGQNLPNTCTVQGRANLSAGLGVVVLFPAVSASFNINAEVGVCVVNGAVRSTVTGNLSVTASGNLVGACGQSQGSGTLSVSGTTPRTFSYVSAATMLVLTGGVAGVANAVSDVTAPNNSCTNGTARVFLVTSVLVLLPLT